MKKDSQTVTKLQYKLFQRCQYVHSNTILISIFCHLPTWGNLRTGATSLMLQDPSYGQNTF